MNIEEIVEEYGTRVFNIAYRITGNEFDAEDATQETFLRVARRLDQFRGESALYTWVYRIAVNTSLLYKKRLSKSYVDNLDRIILEFRDDVPAEVREICDDPEHEAIRNGLISELRSGCYHFLTQRLTDSQQVVFILRVIFRFSLDDISRILSIKKNAVKQRLHRAKMSLKEYFSGRCHWIEGGGDCSCEDRLGFALAAAPQILRMMSNSEQDPRMVELCRDTLRKVDSLSEIYGNLPEVQFRSQELLANLSGPEELVPQSS